MRTVFGIDVSKASSEVAILVNGEKIHGYTMLNDAIGFNRLLNDLKTVQLYLKLLVPILGVFEPFFRNTATRILWKLRSNWIVCEFVKQTKLTLKSWLILSLYSIVNQLMRRKKFINTCVI